jgi:hypothetical protein
MHGLNFGHMTVLMIFIHIYVQNMRNEQFDENAQMKQYAPVRVSTCI